MKAVDGARIADIRSVYLNKLVLNLGRDAVTSLVRVRLRGKPMVTWG